MARIPEIAVTDTHALIWWITGEQRRLGRRAREFFGRVDGGRAVVCIPAMSLVEVDEALADGDLTLAEPFPTFVQRLATTPSRYEIVALTPEIVIAAHGLFRIPERGDRLIAATAAVLGYPLVSRDPDIPEAVGVELIW